MSKLSWIVVAVCLLSLPGWGQSRRRGYTPAGGWHRKSSPPVPAPAPAAKKKKDKKTPQTPPAPPAQ